MLLVFWQMKISLAHEVESTHSTSSSTPSTPGVGVPPTIGQEFADEPIHIINVSIQYGDSDIPSDVDLIKKCYQFVQVIYFFACDIFIMSCDYHVILSLQSKRIA